MQLDALDRKAESVLEGYLVRKDLVRQFSGQFPVPTYVVEFLLGRYCASTDEEEIAEGLDILNVQKAVQNILKLGHQLHLVQKNIVHFLILNVIMNVVAQKIRISKLFVSSVFQSNFQNVVFFDTGR